MSTHRYFPATDSDIRLMLDRCGLKSLDDLYGDVPRELLMKGDYDLPEGVSEQELRTLFENIIGKNARLKACFAGNGFYDKYAPAVIAQIISRSEFLTAYTPYQPEISQGTLQYIFEFQSMMCALTGLDVSNASMYDGTTATAEAMMVAVAHARKRNTVVVSASLHQRVLDVIATYAKYHGVDIITVDTDENLCSSNDKIAEALASGSVAGVIVPVRNRYGIIEDHSGLADACHAAKSLLIMNCIASDLASVKTPGEWGADIAVGDAQSLGIPLSLGGPYLGFMCTTKALMRKIPGRIVGATTDRNGNRTFVLTLQAREQHIRREKATSNICSNQGLMALYVTIYMSLMGASGLTEANEISAAAAHDAARRIVATGRASMLRPDAPFLNEFTLETVAPAPEIIRKGIEQNILAGVALDEHTLMVAVTEKQSPADIDVLVNLIANA